MKLIEVAKEILTWWENAKYETTGDYGEHNVFDSDDKYLFDRLQKAVEGENDGSN